MLHGIREKLVILKLIIRTWCSLSLGFGESELQIMCHLKRNKIFWYKCLSFVIEIRFQKNYRKIFITIIIFIIISNFSWFTAARIGANQQQMTRNLIKTPKN